jgi:nucleoid DNA-binding protein
MIEKRVIIKEIQRELETKEIELSREEILETIETLFSLIKEKTLEQGIPISMRPYGKFERRIRKHPQTGENIQYIYFKIGKRLKQKGEVQKDEAQDIV